MQFSLIEKIVVLNLPLVKMFSVIEVPWRLGMQNWKSEMSFQEELCHNFFQRLV